MKQLSLAIDLDRCIGCKTCVVACRNSHGLVDHENCMPGEIPYYLRVETECSGTYPNLAQTNWVVPCQHCKNAPCVKACPAKAIVKDEQTGIVHILDEKCAGHKACIEACPYGVIQFDAVRRKAHKCDLCWDRIHAGEKPACVEACMTDAMRFGEKELLRMQLEAEGKEIVRKMSAQSVIYFRDPK